MKIGILTFHRAENFGATLQAYALQKYLINNGYDARIVDYRCKAIERNYDIYNPRILISRKNVFVSIRLYLERFRNIQERTIKKKHFRDFWSKYLVLTQPVYKVEEDLGFDAYITGSDQVWNLHLTHGLDKMYFLSFPMKDGAKKISYAASSENDPNGLLWKKRDSVKRMLKSFDAVSVREDFLKDGLARFVPNTISVCLDPTFLLNKSDYVVLSKQPDIREKYVVVYHMTPSKDGAALAERIARKYTYKIIEIFGGYSYNKDKERYKSNLGPSEILGYISNAEVVITTSFHGLALSVILNKEFWVINHSGNYRQRNLLSLLGLDNRLVISQEQCPVDEQIDFSSVKNVLNEAVQSSKDFLRKALDE